MAAWCRAESIRYTEASGLCSPWDGSSSCPITSETETWEKTDELPEKFLVQLKFFGIWLQFSFAFELFFLVWFACKLLPCFSPSLTCLSIIFTYNALQEQKDSSIAHRDFLLRTLQEVKSQLDNPPPLISADVWSSMAGGIWLLSLCSTIWLRRSLILSMFCIAGSQQPPTSPLRNLEKKVEIHTGVDYEVHIAHTYLVIWLKWIACCRELDTAFRCRFLTSVSHYFADCVGVWWCEADVFEK